MEIISSWDKLFPLEDSFFLFCLTYWDPDSSSLDLPAYAGLKAIKVIARLMLATKAVIQPRN